MRGNGGMSPSLTPIKRTVPGQGPNIEQLFQKLGANEKDVILDKIHSMRMRAYDKRGHNENLAKPFMPAYNTEEKSKIIE